nr:amino acid adenylation domain-containing protein [Isoptericola halotolerans]
MTQQLDEITRRQPDDPAVIDTGGTTTFTDLQHASREIAARLAAAGVGHGDVVGVVGHRGARTLASMLAVLRRGAAYLPVDPATPRARLATMVESTGCQVVVTTTDQRVADGLATVVDARADHPTDDTPLRDLPADAEDHAYVMFTSGSTGTPKAVGVTHGGILHLATRNGFLALGPGHRVLHASTLAFDASTLEIWPALLNGACLVVVESDLLLAPEALGERLRTHRVDTAFFTTSLLHHLARTHPPLFDALSQVMTGGEALDVRHAAVVARRVDRLINCYGPTEGTVVATAQVIDPDADGPAPIGRPLPYVDCQLLDEDDGPVRGAGVGELLIGGVGVATGYLHDPERTREKFVLLETAPGRSSRYYRTGDLVRRTGDGLLFFEGRLDSQVKVRGYRIEPAEVEQALRRLDDVTEAAVVDAEDETGRWLVAGVVLSGDRLDSTGVRTRLASVLPDYMLPADIVDLTEIPRTPSGKADRGALRDLAARRRSTGADPDAVPSPGTLAEHVAAAWAATLGVPASAPDEHFFDVGGTSLGAARLVARIQAELELDGASGYDLIRALLSAPRLDDFTAKVGSVVENAGASQPAPEATDRWRADIHLPETTPLADAGHGDRILLTGATGFFGSYLLRELLARTDAVVECLVRAQDPAAGRRRIADAQAAYGHGPLDDDRIVALPADLTAPDLGLSPATFDALARRTSRVYHSAAQVNFVYPYEWLRPTNVDGTRTLARLALRGGGIPLHYVSTIALLSGMGSADVRTLTEDDAVEHVERMSMGYPESKWVAEKVLGLAAVRGVPVSVYRPYEITGNQHDGAWNTEAAIVAFFKAIVEMGVTPDAALPLDFVPADYLARALVWLGERTGNVAGKTYHLTNPSFALLSDMVDRLRLAGHRITTIGYDEWVEELRAFCATSPDHPIVAFLPIFTTVAAQRDVTVKELYFEDLFPRFGQENAEAGLAGSGIECPPVDAAMLDAYIDWFHTIGWIESPARTQAFERA